jgi:hypothetical protein
MKRSRREFLRLGALAAGGLALACLPTEAGGDLPEPATSTVAPAASTSPTLAPEARASSTPTPAPTPRPVPPAGRVERMLLDGSDSATPAVITHSGVEGPRVMILGGVHGNEPGGWLAAENIAEWDIERGSLVVVPRANVIATELLERTTEELGDLNRLYPGSTVEGALPMAQMAAEIASLAREFEVERLLDLHESWAFYRDRNQEGTAFLGQTITTGGLIDDFPEGETLVASINDQIASTREQFIFRGGRSSLSGGIFDSGFSGFPSSGRRGGTSLSLGSYVPGLLPYLVEMGQQGQAVARRAELHRLVARTALEEWGLLTRDA